MKNCKTNPRSEIAGAVPEGVVPEPSRKYELLLHEGVEAYKKEGPKFMQRLVAKQKAN